MTRLSTMVVLIAALHGCSSRMSGSHDELPPRPALGAPIDRVGRPLTANALIGPIAADGVADRRKEAYNRAGPADWPAFAADIEASLGLYDGLDGTCGNQWLAGTTAATARYHTLARLLADDRLWVNSAATICTRYFAVELAALAAPGTASTDCGGRTPLYDANNVFRSMLVLGRATGVSDGIDHDDRETSTTEFPFLAAPQAAP
jgi:hypothetical protein